MPEDLFYEDFQSTLIRSNYKALYVYRRAFEKINRLRKTKSKLAVLEEAVMKATLLEQIPKDDPVVSKLALYILAHRNYLSSLPYEIMRDHKVNWGLAKTLKLAEPSILFHSFDRTFNDPSVPPRYGLKSFSTFQNNKKG